MIKQLKNNWAIFLLIATCIYIMSLSSIRAEKAEKKVEKYKNELDSLQIISDSMYSVLFPIEIELNRHQIAFKIFYRRNPKAAEQYAEIISNETE